jgi:hypothetical protein
MKIQRKKEKQGHLSSKFISKYDTKLKNTYSKLIHFFTIFAIAHAAKSSVPRCPQKKILIDVKNTELRPLKIF